MPTVRVTLRAVADVAREFQGAVEATDSSGQTARVIAGRTEVHHEDGRADFRAIILDGA